MVELAGLCRRRCAGAASVLLLPGASQPGEVNSGRKVSAFYPPWLAGTWHQLEANCTQADGSAQALRVCCCSPPLLPSANQPGGVNSGRKASAFDPPPLAGWHHPNQANTTGSSEARWRRASCSPALKGWEESPKHGLQGAKSNHHQHRALHTGTRHSKEVQHSSTTTQQQQRRGVWRGGGGLCKTSSGERKRDSYFEKLLRPTTGYAHAPSGQLRATRALPQADYRIRVHP